MTHPALTDAPIRQLTPAMVRQAALVAASHCSDVDDARDILNVLGIRLDQQDSSVTGGGTIGWDHHNGPRLRR